MSETLQADFEAAVEKVRNAPADGSFSPSNELKLKMYALFRQATDGDVIGKRPGLLNLIERAKYDAWARARGLTPDKAMQMYVEQVKSIEAEHG